MRKSGISQILSIVLAGTFIAGSPATLDHPEAFAAGANEIYLATEVIEGPTGSSIYSPVEFQGKLYFSAVTSDLGRELYVFDGTTTSLVVDFNPGSASGMYSSNGALGVFNNRLMLIMDDGTTGWELYQFDGSSISLVVDAKPGLDHGYPSDLIEFGGKLYFSATTFVTSSYAFVWDYINPAQLLSDVHGGYSLQGFSSPVVLGSNMYFVSNTAGMTNGIVVFDGTSFTQLPLTPQNPNGLFAFNGGVVYYAKDSDGFEPWFYDGTNQVKVADLNTGSADAYFFNPVVLGGKLYFRARSNSLGFEMWEWDGVNSPTLVSDLYSGASSGHNGILASSFSNELVFLGDDGTSGTEPWLFDGITQSRAVTNNPAGVVNYGNGSGAGAVIGNTLYFVGTTDSTGREIFAYGIRPAGFVAASVPQPATLTYSANGGSGSASVSQLPGSLTLDSGAAFSRDGYTIQGWDFDSTASSASYALSSTINLTQSGTIYAVWQAIPTPVSPPAAPAPPVIPVPVLTNSLDLQVPSSGGNLEIVGSKLDGVYEAWIGSEEATILSKSESKLMLEAPELEPGRYDLLLVSNLGRITYLGAIEYFNDEGDLIAEEGLVTEDTFQIIGFAPGSSLLTAAMKRELGLRVKGLSALRLSCIGQTMGPTILKSDERLALARGVAVCEELSRKFGLSSYSVAARKHTLVGAQYRSTVVELAWTD